MFIHSEKSVVKHYSKIVIFLSYKLLENYNVKYKSYDKHKKILKLNHFKFSISKFCLTKRLNEKNFYE